MTYELGVLGAGNMAEAIVRGVIGKGLLKPEQVIAADPAEARRHLFEQQLHVRSVTDNLVVARDARVLLLSTKPFQVKEVLGTIAPAMREQTLLISIAAGIPIKVMEAALGAGKAWRVIRTMPNTPMLVGEGVVGIARGRNVSDADVARARQIFEAAADVIEVPEEKIDAVTALSGSGPAYFYFLVECMVRAGVAMGLPEDQATRMAVRTAVGAGKLMAASPESSAELRRKVTTPGGTTQAAIEHMQTSGMEQIIIDALRAAEQRGKELGK